MKLCLLCAASLALDSSDGVYAASMCRWAPCVATLAIVCPPSVVWRTMRECARDVGAGGGRVSCRETLVVSGVLPVFVEVSVWVGVGLFALSLPCVHICE